MRGDSRWPLDVGLSFILLLFILFYFILFNSRTRKKIERRQNENGGENTSVRGGVRTRNLPIMCRALYPLRHGDTAYTGRLASAGSS